MKLYPNANLPEDLKNIMYKEMLDNPFVGINLVDDKGIVIYVNKTHGRITGQSPDMYIGRSVLRMADEGLISVSATAVVLATNQSTVLNQSVPGGKTFQVKAIPIRDSNGTIKYVMNYLIDVSELMHMKDKLASFEKQERKLLDEYTLLKKVLRDDKNIIYQSMAIHKVVEQATKISGYDVPVLITGPSGSGKEHIANIIHESGPRKNQPFVKINCAAIPPHLLESELFGYEAGAFTGGNPKGKKGLLECAHKGSVMLDEIGEMNIDLQSKLLRVLQDQEVLRLGSNTPIKVDFRVISATNANLPELIKEKKFRQDLYYRLNVIDIRVPGLNERREDIPLLVDHFLRMFNIKYEVDKKISSEALRYLCEYQFQGHVRELKNIVERLIVQSENDMIHVDDIYNAIDLGYNELTDNKENRTLLDHNGNQPTFRALIAEYEKKVILEYISKFRCPTVAAKALDIDQSTISRKMQKYGIKRK